MCYPHRITEKWNDDCTVFARLTSSPSTNEKILGQQFRVELAVCMYRLYQRPNTIGIFAGPLVRDTCEFCSPLIQVGRVKNSFEDRYKFLVQTRLTPAVIAEPVFVRLVVQAGLLTFGVMLKVQLTTARIG